jgi:hypothetical protein
MIRGFVEGVLAGVCFLYALQTRIIYPDWMLQTLDHPWVILIAVVFALSIWPWSPVSSILILLCILAFIADIYVFTQKQVLAEERRQKLVKEAESDAYGTYAKNEGGESWGWENNEAEPKVDQEPWWTSTGDIVLFDDPYMTSVGNMGPASANIPLAEPNYPLFHGLHEFPPGPAPF